MRRDGGRALPLCPRLSEHALSSEYGATLSRGCESSNQVLALPDLYGVPVYECQSHVRSLAAVGSDQRMHFYEAPSRTNDVGAKISHNHGTPAQNRERFNRIVGTNLFGSGQSDALSRISRKNGCVRAAHQLTGDDNTLLTQELRG